METEKPAIVVDASVILKWVLDSDTEPGHIDALTILDMWVDGNVELIVPTLWVYEVGNVLCLKRPEQAVEIMAGLLDLELLEINLDQNLVSFIISLCRKYKIGFYDAAYLAVAVNTNAELVTADFKFISKIGSEHNSRIRMLGED